MKFNQSVIDSIEDDNLINQLVAMEELLLEKLEKGKIVFDVDESNTYLN